jgi:MvaI/BcnI restriction endonuclease family
MNFAQLKEAFVAAGCTRLYAKPLAENDNSKNQVYFGPGFEALNLFPNAGVRPETDARNHTFKAKLDFSWLLSNGQLSPAPRAQLILYPQYPEVRFSGFLAGSDEAPSNLMVGRLQGRLLFLGVTGMRKIVGFVVASASAIAAEFRALALQPTEGVFIEVPLPTIPTVQDSRPQLIAELARIHRLGWITSKQLSADGRSQACEAPQCGGFTLEAELGIAKNSQAEPDFLGWEVKQYAVQNFDRPDSGKPITLMTPEPDGGFYKYRGVEQFIRRFGYVDRQGRVDRLNFGGKHVAAVKCAITSLTMELSGFDRATNRIVDVSGAIELVNDDGDVAASWSFAKMLEHWSHKHMQAAYIPSQCHMEPRRQYRYGSRVRLAQQTDSLRLLRALASGAVFYDPGIKLENASTSPRVKRRSQFRIASRDVGALYENIEVVSVQ